jgi:glycosyltransferase involved in cell wall biosynthesis
VTRVGWIADPVVEVGGAELTQAELRAAAPAEVQIVDCPPGGVDGDCDIYAIHNCVDYTAGELAVITRRPAVKYHNDVGPWLSGEARSLLARHARPVCASPLQANYMRLRDAALIPPPVDLERFETAALAVNGNRAGSVCVASWRNLGKGAQRAADWGQHHGGVDFYGAGPLAPAGAQPVPYEAMAALLARYSTFVFLPSVLEPFGRLVCEAWAAGCEIVTNNLVGARYWIENDPDAIRTAAGDYWRLVLA